MNIVITVVATIIITVILNFRVRKQGQGGKISCPSPRSWEEVVSGWASSEDCPQDEFHQCCNTTCPTAWCRPLSGRESWHVGQYVQRGAGRETSLRQNMPFSISLPSFWTLALAFPRTPEKWVGRDRGRSQMSESPSPYIGILKAFPPLSLSL